MQKLRFLHGSKVMTPGHMATPNQPPPDTPKPSYEAGCTTEKDTHG
jgi:hypothetical protein